MFDDSEIPNVPDKREQNIDCICRAGERIGAVNTQNGIDVPSMRFPEFDGQWKKYRLSDICSFFSGDTPKSSRKDFYGGDIPFIRSGEIHNERTAVSITEQGVANSTVKMVRKGDLLLALCGVTSGDIAISRIDGAINQAVLCIRTSQSRRFLKYVLEKNMKKILHEYAQGGRRNLSAGILKGLCFHFPSMEEQERLADFMDLLEERIQSQNKIIEDYKALIGGIGDACFRSSVPHHSLGDICTIHTGEMPGPWDIKGHGQYYVMNGGTAPSGYMDACNAPAESISISEGGSSCGYVQYNDVPFWCGKHCYVIDSVADFVDMRYLFHFLKSKESSIMALRKGSGLPNIQKQDILRFPVYVPPADRQMKICRTYDAVRDALGNATMRLEAYRKIKESMMAQLFI